MARNGFLQGGDVFGGRLCGLALLACVGLPTVAGCSPSPVQSSPVQFPAATTGKCRYVTPDEMEKITGLPVIKPVETKGTCEYLYSSDATEPTVEPTDINNLPPLPPSVSIQYETDSYAVNAVDRDIANSQHGNTPVPGLGTSAAWSDDRRELLVRLTNTAIRISVTAPAAPQQFNTSDLKAIAIAVFKAAEPRLDR